MAEWLGLRVDHTQQRLELVLVQEADVGALLDLGAVDAGAGVIATPRLALSESEYLEQQREGVRPRLGRLTVALHFCHQRLDLLGCRPIKRNASELWLQVGAEDRAVGAEGRRLASHRLQVTQHPLGGHRDRHVGARRARLLALDPSAQLSLGLGAGQPVAGALQALGAEPTLHPTAVGPPLSVPSLAATGVGANLQRAAAVAAAGILILALPCQPVGIAPDARR